MNEPGCAKDHYELARGPHSAREPDGCLLLAEPAEFRQSRPKSRTSSGLRSEVPVLEFADAVSATTVQADHRRPPAGAPRDPRGLTPATGHLPCPRGTAPAHRRPPLRKVFTSGPAPTTSAWSGPTWRRRELSRSGPDRGRSARARTRRTDQDRDRPRPLSGGIQGAILREAAAARTEADEPRAQ